MKMSDLFRFFKIFGWVTGIFLYITAIVSILCFTSSVGFLILGILMITFGLSLEIFILGRD